LHNKSHFYTISIQGKCEFKDGANNVRYAENCDFPGNDFTNVRVASNLCGDECAKNSECTSFAWTDFNGGTCWLKNGKVTEGDGVPKNGVVAGIAKRGPPGEGKGKSSASSL
jgi:hypothetical protein